MYSQSVDESRSPIVPPDVDEQALADAQARLALALAALDGAAEALVEAGLSPDDCASIERSKDEIAQMQRLLGARLDRQAATIQRSIAIADLVDSDREAASAPEPVDGRPDIDAALALLFGESGIGDLETDTGRHLTALVEYRTGGLVTVSTDCGLTEEGDRLVGSVVDHSGAPWRVDMCVESEHERGGRTHLALRVEDVAALERRVPAQLEIGGSATLVAIDCGGLPPDAEVLGRVVGLSESGVSFTTHRPLRTGDRLRFHGRFFSEEVRARIRVASVDADSEASDLVVGSWFEEIDDGGQAAIGRVLDHALHPEAPISYDSLRLLTHRKPERRRGVRGLLGR